MNDSTASTDWTVHKGPGFTVRAPAAPKIEKVPANEDARELERYTYFTTELESYVVEITEISEKDDLGLTLNNMRMMVTSRTVSVRGEDLIDRSETMGEVTGRDIWYVIVHGDHTLHARSKLLGKGHRIYEVRGIGPKNGEAAAERFVDSFALVP